MFFRAGIRIVCFEKLSTTTSTWSSVSFPFMLFVLGTSMKSAVMWLQGLFGCSGQPGDEGHSWSKRLPHNLSSFAWGVRCAVLPLCVEWMKVALHRTEPEIFEKIFPSGGNYLNREYTVRSSSGNCPLTNPNNSSLGFLTGRQEGPYLSSSGFPAYR
jgi:hypothetical protein